MTTAPYQLLKELACIVNKPLLAIGLFSFSISSSICSKALLQKEVGCRCVLFLSSPPSPFVSERGRSWRLKFSQLVTLTTSQSKAEYLLCVPVFTCEPIFGTYQHIAWFHFSTSPLEIGSWLIHFFEKERRKLFRTSLKWIRNKIVVVCSFSFFFFPDLSLMTKVPIIEIVLSQN